MFIYRALASIFFLQISSTAAKDDYEDNVEIIKYSFDNDGSGNYYFNYLLTDGQSREETGSLSNPESQYPDYQVKGSYSYAGSDGKTYTVHYTADKDGFHPEGDHIKVPPYTPWPTNRHLEEEYPNLKEEADFSRKYLPSSEKPPQQNFNNQNFVSENFSNDDFNMLSSTTLPPKITNAYLPDSIKEINNDIGELKEPSENYSIGRRGGGRKIPPTPQPSLHAVTISPLNHIALGSSPVPLLSSRKRLYEVDREAKSALFEVIQNSHSARGIFKS